MKTEKEKVLDSIVEKVVIGFEEKYGAITKEQHEGIRFMCKKSLDELWLERGIDEKLQEKRQTD